MYFKITNEKENHNGFQYADGLNILEEEFCDDPNKSCCAGGFYFTDANNILKFMEYGINLRRVILPTNNPEFRMVMDKSGDKWRANMIILGDKYDLFKVDTFKYLVESGADIHANNDYALRWSEYFGHSDVLQYLKSEMSKN